MDATGSRMRWPVVWYVTRKTNVRAESVNRIARKSKIVSAVRLFDGCRDQYFVKVRIK